MATLTASRPESAASLREPKDPQLPQDASEFYHYEDTGCEVSDSCLDCPLPLCRYDDPTWFQRNRRLARDFRIVHAMQKESLSIHETAKRFSITTRTVFRVIQRCREAAVESAGGQGMTSAA